MSEPYIRVDAVSKVFNSISGDDVCALDNLVFDVKPREFVTIVGPI